MPTISWHASIISWVINYQRARLYAMEGNYPQAIKQYKWIQQQNTTQVNPLVYSQLADCFLKMDSLLAATACYYNALKFRI